MALYSWGRLWSSRLDRRRSSSKEAWALVPLPPAITSCIRASGWPTGAGSSAKAITSRRGRPPSSQRRYTCFRPGRVCFSELSFKTGLPSYTASL